jgi:nuclear protein localization family protein 4
MTTLTLSLHHRCTHGPRGACHHCCPPGGPDAVEAKQACLHGPREVCVNCMKSKSSGEEIEWLCTHPPDQMCINCGGAAKGEKVELSMLCLHGPSGFCVNCLPDDEVGLNLDRKHMTYQEYIDKQKARCEHNFNAKCNNCIPPSDVSYKIKPGCTKHKPWPLGLCSECQSIT